MRRVLFNANLARLVLIFIVAGHLDAQTSVSLPSNFPPKAIGFQEYDYGTGTFAPMRFAGNETFGNGDITSTGPVYVSANGINGFPYAMLDTTRNIFFFHPGTFATVQNGAVVSAGIPTAGTYNVSGAFARANDFQNAGDGVRVVAFVNNQIGTPLFDAVISSNNVVNPNSPFSGTGVAPFSFTVSLAQGDTVQFAVFSGPLLLDGTFDFTALEFNISSGAAPCTYSLSSPGQSFTAAGGLGSFTVNTSPTCGWALGFSAGWITADSPGASPGGGSPQGTGTRTITFNVAANSSGARAGSVSVGGQTYSVTQAAFSCSYLIGPTSASPADTGGNLSVSVSAPGGCAWTAVSNVPWAIVHSGASGSGGGVVVLTVAPNTGGPRSGTATIAGQTFTVNQGAGACGALDVTSEVGVSPSGLTYIPFSTYLYSQRITVSSSSDIFGPVYLVLIGEPTYYGYPKDSGLYGGGSTTSCFSSPGDYLILISGTDLVPGHPAVVPLLWFKQGAGGVIRNSFKVLSGTPSH